MVLIFVSSLNENLKLANSIKTYLNSKNIEAAIINLVDLNLPLYNSKIEETSGIPNEVLKLVSLMKNSSSYIFVNPEYNSCLTPVLVNTIAWVSRVGDDFRELFSLKKIQLATFSNVRGYDMLNALRIQLSRMGSIVMPREIIVTTKNELNVKSMEKILDTFTNTKV